MKKIIIGLLLFLSVSLCFAKGVLDDNTEMGVGYHAMSHTATRNYTKENWDTNEKKEITGDITNTVSSFIVYSYAYTSYSAQNIGLGFYVNILLPQATANTVQLESNTPFPIAVDFILGPAFRIYDSEITFVSLGTGIHGLIIGGIYDGDRDVYSYQLGLGANITGALKFSPSILGFTPKLYVYARLQLSYDFYSWEMWDPPRDSDRRSGIRNSNISAWSINPTIGIGYRKQ